MTVKERPQATAAQTREFLQDVVQGLSRSPKQLPCKYLYDAQGTYYFEKICRCPEYYVTRTELAIMRQSAHEMAELIGDRCLMMEYGSGSGIKTRLLFDHLKRPCAYIPIDISADYLEHVSRLFRQAYSDVEVLPVGADFTRPFKVPAPSGFFRRRLIYFPGSTLGNFTPPERKRLMHQMHAALQVDDLVLLGIDLKKRQDILHQAYNDHQGYTARFNLNALARINRELGGDFCLEHFRHSAFYNKEARSMEMHLVSLCSQKVTVAAQEFYFHAGEGIHTESSCKFDPREFQDEASSAGFKTQKFWTDQDRFFAVVLLKK